MIASAARFARARPVPAVILASMPTPRAEPRHALLLALVAVAATAVLARARRRGAGRAGTPADERCRLARARRLAGRTSRSASACIVVLKTPSLARACRARRADSRARAANARWTATALAAQHSCSSRGSRSRASPIKPDYSFARVLERLLRARSTRARSRCSSATPRSPASIPVRIAYPSTRLDPRAVARRLRPAVGAPAELGLPGVRRTRRDDRAARHRRRPRSAVPARPHARGHRRRSAATPTRSPRSSPDDPSQLERHGTQMAGLLVGAGGPVGPRGRRDRRRRAARSASRAGSPTRSATGRSTRAATRSSRGSSVPSTRTTTATRTTPRASRSSRSPSRSPRSPTGPEARAAAGALALDTLVVAPAGNDGRPRPGYGDIAGPGGAPAALTVGALDCAAAGRRGAHRRPRRVSRRCSTATRRSRGAVAPEQRLDLTSPCRAGRSAARGARRRGSPTSSPHGLQHRRGPRRARPRRRVAVAARPRAPRRAGAAAVLLYGGARRCRPAGSGSTRRCPVPVVVHPARARRAALLARIAGAAATVAVALGIVPATPNAEHGRVASFSSPGSPSTAA